MGRVYIIGIDHVLEKTTYIYQYLEKSGFKVTYFSSDDAGFSKAFYKENIVFLSYGKLLSLFVILFYLIFKRPKHVEFYFSRLYFETFPTLILCKFLMIPTSLVSRGMDLRDHFSHKKIRQLLTKFIARNVNLILAKERSHLKVLDTFNLKKKVFVKEIHNGIPLEKFTKNKFGRNKKTFLFLNSFREIRKVNLLINAFSILNKSYPEARLLLIGSSLNIDFLPQKKEKVREEKLMSLISDLNLEKVIDVLPFSTQPWKKINNILSFVNPSDPIWLNNSLLEAMAYSIPPIITDADRASDIIIDNKERLITPQHEQSFADAMAYMLRNTDRAEIMGESARKKVISNFSSERVGKEIFDLYKEKLWKN